MNLQAGPDDELMTLVEAAALARVHRDTLRTWCVRGRLPSVVGPGRGQRRVRRGDVEDVVRERDVGSRARQRNAESPMGPPATRRSAAVDAPAARRRAGAQELQLLNAAGVPGASRRPATVDSSMAAEDTLRRLAAELSGKHDLEAMFEDVLVDSERMFAADHSLVGLWTDGPNQPMGIVASRNIPAEALEQSKTLDAHSRTAGYEVARNGTFRVIESDHPDIDPRFRALYQRLGIATVSYVPIVFRGEPLGAISLYHDRPHVWTPGEIDLARSYGDSIAAAVGNARLIDSVQLLAARLRSVQDLAARLNGLTDVQGIGEAIVAEAGSLIAFDTIRVYRVQRDTAMCEPIAFQGTFMGTSSPTPEMLRVPIGTGLTGWVAEHDEPLMVRDAQSDGRSVIVGRVDGPESMLLVPMSFEDTVRGVIVVSRLGLDRFTADDQATLTIFAGYAAQALVNAERLEQLHHQQAELEHQLTSQRRLMAVNERLLSTLDASSVLEVVADSLKAVVMYDSLTIYRVDVARQIRYPVIARDRFAEVILEYEAPLGTGITGWAVENQEAVLANDAILDPRSIQIPGTPVEPESLIVVPLIVQGEVLGTLNVSRTGEAEAHFSQNEFELTKLFAAQAAIALRNAETHGEVKVQAERDALTGLRNHGAFQRELALTIALTDAHPVALLMMDLDRFKAYNDTFGHPSGDVLLVSVARAIEAAVRTGDSAYRYGGDEFTVILPQTDRAGADEVARRIRVAVDGINAQAAGTSVSISVGVASLPGDGFDKDSLMEAADAALYVAKGSRLRSGTRDPFVAALDETAGALLDGANADDLLVTILGRAAGLLGTAHAYLYLAHPDGQHLEVRAGIGLFEAYVGFTMSVNEGLAGAVYRTGRSMNVDDYDAFDGRIPEFNDKPIGAVLGVPLTSNGRVIGVIGLASGSVERTWREPEVDALNRFAQLASIALENARLQAAALRGPVDPVTGLATRQRLVDAIEAAGAPGEAVTGAPISVMLLDIDRFKVINESLGHQAGDRVLAEVGRRIADILGEGDLVTRFGGDEFGILLAGGAGPDAGTHASAVADLIVAAMKAPIDVNGRLWFISVSIGFAVGGQEVATSGALLREAEVALVQAQSETTTRVARFDPLTSRAALERLDLEAELQAAIEHDELVVHYQPILDLRTERIMGFEALVRWQHPVRGLVPPAAFIPLAEETDLIIPLGAVVLAKACRQARTLRDRWPGERIVMSVNLSPRQFSDPELVPSIAAILAETGLEPSALELEITETAVMSRSAASMAALAALRALGVRLVLDDFGTGYSSLAYLRHLPLDTIKVDRSFITDLDDRDPNLAIVTAVVSLAHGLGISVVAEGIELESQFDRLRDLGCDLGQGYLWSRPIAESGLDALMAAAADQRRLPKSRSRNRNRLMKSR